MAGRTSSSVAVGVTITILAILTLGLFVTTAVYFGQYNTVKSELDTSKKESDKYATNADKNDPVITKHVQAAEAKGRQSLARYMKENHAAVMKAVTGQETDGLKELEEKIKASLGENAPSLLAAITERDTAVASLTKDLADSNAARDTAVNEFKASGKKLEAIKAEMKVESDKLVAQIKGYETELAGYRKGFVDTQKKVEDEIKSQEAAAKVREDGLKERVSKLESDNLVLVDQLSKLRGEQNRNIIKGHAEESLVDGTVVGLLPSANEVSISLGRKQKIQLGMSFAVYADANQIKIDERTGEYRRGKATLEVIEVGEDTSKARVTSETRGSPVVRGDVIANAVYDPTKVYKFVVFGNFDTNGDGVATPGERGDLTALLADWGGTVSEELQGDVDFLVLGEKPILPPKPDVNVPLPVVQEYVRISDEVKKYEDFYKTAGATSVPILNQNRLFTLIGKTPVNRR